VLVDDAEDVLAGALADHDRLVLAVGDRRRGGLHQGVELGQVGDHDRAVDGGDLELGGLDLHVAGEGDGGVAGEGEQVGGLAHSSSTDSSAELDCRKIAPERSYWSSATGIVRTRSIGGVGRCAPRAVVFCPTPQDSQPSDRCRLRDRRR
jgi:hypothetical protein